MTVCRRDRTAAGKASRVLSHSLKKPVMTVEVEKEEQKKHTSISDSRYSLAGQLSIRTDRRSERRGVTHELHQKIFLIIDHIKTYIIAISDGVFVGHYSFRETSLVSRMCSCVELGID